MPYADSELTIQKLRDENAALRAEVAALTAERDRQRGAAEKYYAEVEELKRERDDSEKVSELLIREDRARDAEYRLGMLEECLSDYSRPNFTDRYGTANRIRAALDAIRAEATKKEGSG